MLPRLLAVSLLALLFLGFSLSQFPPPAAAQIPALESLPPCNFNAYTERDDLIIGAVVLNMASGAGCTQNLNSMFQVASVGKLFIAGALYEQVARGLFSFQTELTFSSDYLMSGRDDCLNEARVGDNITLGELSNLMIQCSDNVATWMIMDFIGWGTVSQYIASLGIPGINEVIPYSQVDRLKLIMLDPRWENVPTSLASQFYRRRFTEGLVPTYFDQEPSYSQRQLREVNARYQAEYLFNTMTPHAMASYLLKLYADVQKTGTSESLIAQYVFNTMLLTQRMFSTQYMPGNVYAGSKNGFDIGIRAEVNITVDNVDSVTRIPETISIIFVRHRDVTRQDVPYRFRNTPIEEFLFAIAPKVTELLYPNTDFDTPVVQRNEKIRTYAFNAEALLFPCWENYLGTDALAVLQSCWSGIPYVTTLNEQQFLGFGVVLRDLFGADVRMTLIYTLPDGRKRSYQMQRFFEQDTALAWYEEVSIPGGWRLDVYYNLQPVFSQPFYVE